MNLRLIRPAAGAMGAAMIAAYTTAPFDVVKTRLQVQTVSEGGYKGIWDALRSIGRDEGARAYWKGAGARALWLGPNSALCMLFCAFLPPYPHPAPSTSSDPLSDELFKEHLADLL